MQADDAHDIDVVMPMYNLIEYSYIFSMFILYQFCALVVNLSTQDNAKLPEQLECFFKTTINWDKYQSKISRERPNQYLDYLIGPSFRGVNRHFVLSFENNAHQKSHKRYFFSTVEVKYYNFMIDGKSFFDQPVKNNLRTYDSIFKIAKGQGDDSTTGCLLHYI